MLVNTDLGKATRGGWAHGLTKRKRGRRRRMVRLGQAKRSGIARTAQGALGSISQG